mmetsp:Transcript_9076/g.13683  ORF Transcript_9076/g.13683 Transcript_9076/m.13683 type:complete len:339 (-) Transcript_9076:394-1410(-)
MLPPIHVPIARGTTANPTSPQLVLSLHIQPIALRARRNDHGVRLDRARVRTNPHRSLLRIDLHDRLRLEGRSELHRLGAHEADHRGTRDVEQPRVILHVDSLALELSSHGRGHHHGPQSGAGRVDGGAESGGSASDDGDAFGEFGLDPGVFELGVVVLLVLDLGVLLGVEALFDLGEELFFRGEVQIGRFGFASRFLLLLLLFVAAGTAVGGASLRDFLGLESLLRGGSVPVLLFETLDQVPRHAAHAELIGIVALDLIHAPLVNLRHVLLALRRVLLAVVLRQFLRRQQHVLELGLTDDILGKLSQLSLAGAAEFLHLLPAQEEFEGGETAHVIPRG